MDNQSVIYHVHQQSARKTGIANMQAAMVHAGVSSRTTLLAWERKGLFPRRVEVRPGRVGYRWSDLYAWSDGLQTKEGNGNGQ